MPPTVLGALKSVTICRDRGHLKTKVPQVSLSHSNVSAPSARKLFFEFICIFIFSWRKVRLRRTFLDSQTRVRRRKYSSLAQRDVMGRAL